MHVRFPYPFKKPKALNLNLVYNIRAINIYSHRFRRAMGSTAIAISTLVLPISFFVSLLFVCDFALHFGVGGWLVGSSAIIHNRYFSNIKLLFSACVAITAHRHTYFALAPKIRFNYSFCLALFYSGVFFSVPVSLSVVIRLGTISAMSVLSALFIFIFALFDWICVSVRARESMDVFYTSIYILYAGKIGCAM